MLTEISISEARVGPEVLSPEIRQWYEQYAKDTWRSIDAMVCPNGLPADHLHYLRAPDGKSSETFQITNRTSPTNIGFKLACDCAAGALKELPIPEAQYRAETTLATILDMMKDPQVFVLTNNNNEGLFVNWIQPSIAKACTHWLPVDSSKQQTPAPLVEQQLSSIDNAWLKAYLMLTKAQFPQLRETVDNILARIDLSFMIDPKTKFFRGVYLLDPPGFKPWQYDKLSENRILYAVGDNETAELLAVLLNNRSENSIYIDPTTGLSARKTWDGEGFTVFWPALLVPEGELSSQWKQTYEATIQAQKKFGAQHNNGHYGYSAGLGPDGKYYEFRVPEMGESSDPYEARTVITISALVNMGIIKPIETCLELQRLHAEFEEITHPGMGDGDTVDTATGECQPDQLFPNQATSLLACWNILNKRQPQNLFMQVAPPALKNAYEQCSLW